MLRITVEYLPGGRKYNPERLATINISNMSKLADVSNYLIEVEERESKKDFMVHNHERRSGWKVLIKRVFERLEELK